MNKNDKKKKRNISPPNQNKKEDKYIKKPLFKIFMEENNKKKLHLLKGNISNSKDSGSHIKPYEGEKFYNNKHLNLQLFSFKVLEAKHNSTPELYLKKSLNILIKKKKSHLLAYFNELYITTGTLKDYLKRYYNYKEIKERIPKYVSYYKNYLTFFCRPFFVNYILNKKMVRHMEKVAQVFYNENYADEDKEEEEKNKKKKDKESNKYIQIFSKKITQDIENCDVFTVVTSEAAMKQIQKINNKINNKINKKIFQKIKNDNEKENNKNNNKINLENNNKENNTNNVNNMAPIQIEQLTIVDNNYKITPINSNEHRIEIKTNKIISELKNKDIIPQTTNSINLLIDELEQKDNNLNSNTKNEIEYKTIDKEKDIIKNINNNCIVIQGGKTTNNINININHLTIGQKLISQNDNNKILNNLALLQNNNNNNMNNSKKIIKKLKHRNNVSNSVNNKEKNSIQKVSNNVDNIPLSGKTSGKTKDKNTNNCSLTLPPPAQNILSSNNSNLSKKYNQIFPNTINNYSIKQAKDARNTPIFKNQYNSGSLTSLNKYIKFGKGNYAHVSQAGKNTIYTNKSNLMKNMFKNINYGTTKSRKNNIIYTKNIGILSGERSRSISNMQKRPKRVIYSSLHFNGSNIQLINLKNNFDMNKNSENKTHSINKRNEIDNKIRSDKIPNIKRKEENKANKLKIKDLNLKGKHLNLQKILNIVPKKTRTKSTGK